MFEQEYRHEMEQLGPDQRQIERLCSILEPQQKRRPHLLRRVVLAAAVSLVLAASAMALSPTLRETVAQLWGGFAPYAQTVEDAAAVDQGIEVKVLDALADGERGKAYIKATDLVGTRLTADTALNNNSCCSYDPATKTALFDFNLSILGEGVSDLPVWEIHTIYPGIRRDFQKVPLPTERMVAEARASRSLTDQERKDNSYQAEPDLERWVLTPDQTPAELGTDLFRLSSIGFDEAGLFHVQLVLADGLDASEGRISLRSAALDREMIGLRTDYIQFTQDGKKYVDYAYPTEDLSLEPADWGILEGAYLSGYLREGEPIHGTWKLSFPLEQLEQRIITLSEPFDEATFTLEKLTFSMQGFQAEGSTSGSQGMLDKAPATLYLADGTTLALGASNGGGESTWQDMDTDVILNDPAKYEEDVNNGIGHFENYWYYEEPVDPATIVGIAFGERLISLE